MTIFVQEEGYNNWGKHLAFIVEKKDDMRRILERPKTEWVCWQAKKAWAALNIEAGKLKRLAKLG